MDAAQKSSLTESGTQVPCRGTRRIWLAMVALIGSMAAGGAMVRADDAASTETTPSPTAGGKLVICGGGVLPIQLRNRFIELAGGTDAHVVVITTASVYADTDKMEAKLGFWREQQLASLTILHTRSRRTADDARFAAPLREATGVWFVGGNQNWLTETYLGTVTEQEIRGVLVRSGVVGGTSAGAAIMSPVMIRRDRPEVQTGPGFGFLPGTVVDQHFLKRNRQGRLLKVLDLHPNLVGLGIDEGTGVVVEGNLLSVVGDSQVVVYSSATSQGPQSVQSLEPGTQTDLTELRTLVAHLVAKPAVAAISATVSAPASETPSSQNEEKTAATSDDTAEASPDASKVGQ
jgi:cyanophycinase